VLYYRLRQVDNDGQYQYSKVLRLRFRDGSFYINRIYPQPAADIMYLDMTNVRTSTNATITFINLNGVVVRSSIIVLNPGDNIVDVNISSLPAGAYFLKIYDKETQVVQRWIKR